MMLFSMTACCIVWVGMTIASAIYNNGGGVNDSAARAVVSMIFIFGACYSVGKLLRTQSPVFWNSHPQNLTRNRNYTIASSLPRRGPLLRDASQGYGFLVAVSQYWQSSQSICCKSEALTFPTLAISYLFKY